MRASVAATPFVLLCASGVLAADMLPLQRGIYVEAGIPCKGASNADTVSYWGDDNGINGTRTGCKIKTLHRDGPVYSLNRKCRQLGFSGSYNDHVKITVLDRTSFKFRARGPFGTTVTTFRYCGPKVQF
jgi:hypothetical protein